MLSYTTNFPTQKAKLENQLILLYFYITLVLLYYTTMVYLRKAYTYLLNLIWHKYCQKECSWPNYYHTFIYKQYVG